MTDSVAPLALTLGDPTGIGPEITLKAWAALRDDPALTFAVIGPLSVFQDAAGRANLAQPEAISDFAQASDVFPNALPVIDMGACPSLVLGEPDPALAPFITGSIARAVTAAHQGRASAVVTNPIAKDVLYQSGFAHPGHTEYLGALTDELPYAGTRGPVMMLSGGWQDGQVGLRVALATVHMSLVDATAQLSQNKIIRTATVLHETLIRDFGIPQPRIALTGLNPHAGEGGALGREEIDIINPAAQTLRKAGIDATDAQSADTLFHTEARAGYDAVLAMYHDQGLIPVKTLDFHGGVNITLGLPIIRTSPDHGTAFGIAGQGVARADSLIAALRAARTIADSRTRHAE